MDGCACVLEGYLDKPTKELPNLNTVYIDNFREHDIVSIFLTYGNLERIYIIAEAI